MRVWVCAVVCALSLLLMLPSAAMAGEVDELEGLASSIDGLAASVEGSEGPSDSIEESDVIALDSELAEISSLESAGKGQGLADLSAEEEASLLGASTVTLTSGSTDTRTVSKGNLVIYKVNITSQSVVQLRVRVSGGGSSYSLVDLYPSNGNGGPDADNMMDCMYIKSGSSETGAFTLTPAYGPYYFAYFNSDSSTTVKTTLKIEEFDSSKYTLVNSDNRSIEGAVKGIGWVNTDKYIVGTFYWGFSSTVEGKYLDGHYYAFQLSSARDVTLYLATSGTAYIALIDSEGNTVEIDGKTLSGKTSGTNDVTSVSCGTLAAGTYYFDVVTGSSTAWRNAYLAEVSTSAPTSTPRSVYKTEVMYRLYNPNSGEHFYTASSAERDNLVTAGWSYEGVGWTAPKSSGTPVYRMYNPNPSPATGSGEHHYTTSAAERDSLMAAGWQYEGIGWYSDDAKGTPLYRLYNPNEFNNNHHYTTSTTERDNLLSLGWRDEGIAWYGV